MSTMIEEKYMRRALQLARMGRGSVSPNPMVGAVITAQGRIIGEGYHRKYGGPHAEVNAINSVSGEDRHLLKESTIYVTLEPCSHYGKTPPCSKLIIDSNIPNVVIGTEDPFKEVSGRGINMLKEAGINVITGVLKKECDELNCHFMTAHRLLRPYILLKWAESADHYIDRIRDIKEKPTVFSTKITSTLVHKLRSEYDAIMVGARSAKLDNPSLTVRDWSGRNPKRIVVGRKNFTLEGSNLDTNEAKTITYYNKSLPEICSELYKSGITSLIVEGGSQLLKAFFKEGLWDEARIEQAPWNLGKGVQSPQCPTGIKQISTFNENIIIRVKKQ